MLRGSQANSQIAVGLIGCGGRGSYDAGVVNADARARVMALCDKYPDEFDKAESEKLLAAPDVDAVFIATPLSSIHACWKRPFNPGSTSTARSPSAWT
jgi:predicted dehydrogenase